MVSHSNTPLVLRHTRGAPKRSIDRPSSLHPIVAARRQSALGPPGHLLCLGMLEVTVMVLDFNSQWTSFLLTGLSVLHSVMPQLVGDGAVYMR